MNNDYISIGVDIGGSHILSAAIDRNTGDIISDSRTHIKIDNKAPLDIVLKDWSSAINETIQKVGADKINGVGFAMPGPFNYREGIALFKDNDKYESLYGVHIESKLRPYIQLENAKFRFHNDASCFAIGVSAYGASKGYKRSIAITLGTGFGSAFIDDGVPVVEREDVPEDGCLWHLAFQEGKADDYFSTRWFVNEYEKRFGERLSGVKEVAEACGSNKQVCELFDQFGHNLGSFLAPWIKKFNPGIVVIGGNISGAFDLFSPKLYETMKDNQCDVVFKVSQLMEDAAIVGGAKLLDDQYFDKIKDVLPTK